MNIAEGDFLSFTEKEQKLVTSRLVSAGNKRARRFVKITGQDINLKSYTSGGKFSVKGKTKKSGELYKEFKRVKEFLSRKTSSARGYKEYINKMKESPTYVGVRKEDVVKPKDEVEGYEYDPETGEIIRPYKSQEDFELENGDVWQATEDALEGSRYDFEQKIVYEIHDAVLDYMGEQKVDKYKNFTSEQKKDLKKIIDSYIQGSGKNATFTGNM